MDRRKKFRFVLKKPDKRKEVGKLVARGHDLNMALQVVQLNRASYYRKPSPVIKTDRRQCELDNDLVKKLNKLSGYNTFYGYCKVAEKLKDYNHKQVFRPMKKMNMLQPRKLKKFHKHRLPISRQTNYLFNIIDVYDKEPIGDYYRLRCRVDKAILSMKEAVQTKFGSLDLVLLSCNHACGSM